VCRELGSQRPDERHAASSCPALRLVQALALIPAALNADEAYLEVDILPAQGLELAPAQAGIQGGGPERAVVLGQGGDQSAGLLGVGDPVAAAAHRRQREAERRVLYHLRAGDGTAEDRS